MPAWRAYDPGFVYETAVIVRDGIRRMYANGEECFYYLTVYNEDHVQPAKPADSGIAGVSVDQAIVAGLFRVTSPPADRPVQLRLLASGPAVRAAQQAAATLVDQQGVAAEVWSVTTWKALRDDALAAERRNRDHPDAPRRVSHLHRALGDGGVPVVAVSDYVSALPDTLARFTGAPFSALGTDGYGLSDTREELRAHFYTDADGITAAALTLLTDRACVDQMRVDRMLAAVPGQGRQGDHPLVA